MKYYFITFHESHESHGTGSWSYGNMFQKGTILSFLQNMHQNKRTVVIIFYKEITEQEFNEYFEYYTPKPTVEAVSEVRN